MKNDCITPSQRLVYSSDLTDKLDKPFKYFLAILSGFFLVHMVLLALRLI